MKKFLLAFFMLIPMLSWAQELVQINGIWYNVDVANKVAEVTNKLGGGVDGSKSYSGSITIPASIVYNGTTCSVTSIGDEAFYDCPSLTSVTIPTSVTSIGFNAFWGCDSLTSVTIPTSVTSIRNAAFWCCTGLTSVSIPNSVTSIGEGAFWCCYGLTSIVVEDGNTKYDSRENCNCLIETATNTLLTGCRNSTIPNSVTSIGNQAFSRCSSLTSVTIPGSVTSIGAGAFMDCTSLTSVTIPKSVMSIGYEAFRGCSVLMDVYCLAETIPSTISNAFNDANLSNATLHVPSATVSTYKSQAPWSEFGKIVALNDMALVDGEPYTNTRRTTYDALTFSKTFASGAVNKWNALYVPIRIDVESSNGEFDIAEIYAFCATVDTNGDGTVDANDERFLFVRPVTSGRTYPNTPYLIRPREAKTYTIKSADNILYEKRDGKVEFSTTKDKFVVTGLNESFTVVAGDNNYFVTGTGALSYRTTGSTTVKPNRWVMHREDREYSDIPDYVEDSNHLDNEENGESGAKEYRILVIGEEISEADAITAVKKANGVFTSGIYTLDGRKMSDSKPLPNGVYVKNGKKYIVK